MTAIDACGGTPGAAGPPPRAGRAASADLDVPADQVLLAATGENFSVSPVLLPAVTRRHLEAVYSFARLVDDLGDEADGDRLALLDAFDADLVRIWDGGPPAYPVLRTLARTVAACGLPPEPFRALIEANRLDQRVSRYDTFEQLLHYCTLSADPIGQMVLGVFGKASPDRVALSDRICTALQLAEHWQDVAEDYARGRVYLPREDLDAFGVREADLAVRSAGPALRNLMAFEVARARTILDLGAGLTSLLSGRLRFAIAGFVGGGRAALDAVRRAGYDVLPAPPKASKRRIGAFALAAAVRSYAPSARSAALAAVASPLAWKPAAAPPARAAAPPAHGSAPPGTASAAAGAGAGVAPKAGAGS
jgi:squalene synthase HpnC